MKHITLPVTNNAEVGADMLLHFACSLQQLIKALLLTLMQPAMCCRHKVFRVLVSRTLVNLVELTSHVNFALSGSCHVISWLWSLHTRQSGYHRLLPED